MTLSLKNQLLSATKALRAAETPEGTARFTIHRTLRHLTAFYERLRTLLDYQEERFIRRLAIRRIIFRRILIQGKRGAVGEALVTELIRAGYVEAGRVSVVMVKQIDEMLTKYLLGITTIEKRYSPRDMIGQEQRLLGIAAAEIEDVFSSPAVEDVIVRHFAMEIAATDDRELDEQARVIAVRTLLKADPELVSWHLFKEPSNPLWEEFQTNPTAGVSGLLRQISKVEALLRERKIEAKVRYFERFSARYKVLADFARKLDGQFGEVIQKETELSQKLGHFIEERLQRTDERLRRSMVRATLYIFATKMLFAVALEVPYDIATSGHIAYLPLAINLIVPPFLMVLATLGIRSPGQANTNVLVTQTKSLLLETETELPERIQRPRRKQWLDLIFSLLYIVTYVVTFGGLIWLLVQVGFNLAGILVFLFFLSVVGFFAYRIRNSSKDLAVIPEREGPLFLVFDFFALPFLHLGRWLSVTIRQMNVVLFVLDFIIEAPLKVVFVAIEDWFTFLREKREELG